MKEKVARETLKITEGIDVNVNQKTVSMQGALGKLERDFSHAPIDIRREGNEILIEAVAPNKKAPNKKVMAVVGTVRSHIKNMMTGVTKGFTYKLKIVYAHFPMSVKVTGDEVVIENFGGERKPRTIKVLGDVKVSVSGDDVLVKGMDIEKVSQVAANIQQGTLIKNKDPRIFLDGIYIYEKGEGI